MNRTTSVGSRSRPTDIAHARTHVLRQCYTSRHHAYWIFIERGKFKTQLMINERHNEARKEYIMSAAADAAAIHSWYYCLSSARYRSGECFKSVSDSSRNTTSFTAIHDRPSMWLSNDDGGGDVNDAAPVTCCLSLAGVTLHRSIVLPSWECADGSWRSANGWLFDNGSSQPCDKQKSNN